MSEESINPVAWGKLIEKIDNMHCDVKDIKIKIDKQNGRVRKLEIWRGWIIGAAIGGATVVSYAVNYFLK